MRAGGVMTVGQITRSSKRLGSQSTAHDKNRSQTGGNMLERKRSNFLSFSQFLAAATLVLHLWRPWLLKRVQQQPLAAMPKIAETRMTAM